MTSDGFQTPSRRDRARRAVRRVLLGHRRSIAAVCAAVAVVAGIRSARPPSGPTVTVAVAAHDLPGGTVLVAGDLEQWRYPAGVAPRGSVADAAGRMLAAPVRRGEPVTDVRLVAPSLVSAYPGLVALPVRVADADAAALLRVGDHVDLVAADPRHATASYVAVHVPVLALPTPTQESSSGGLSGRLVVIGTVPGDVDRIVGASATDLLSVVISG
jgi:Flp pilus assembly protein CpaB